VNRHGIRASAVAGLLSAVAVGAATPAALGCKCIPPSAATVKAADVVFTGTVTARSDPDAGKPVQSSIDPITFTLAVDDELKGDVDASAQVVTPRESASCGVDFQVGERYLVVADRDGGVLRTGLCQGTRALPAGAPLPEFARGLDTSAPADAAWPAPARVSLPAEGTQSPDVAIGPAGTATAVWLRTTYAPEEREAIATSRLFAAGSSTGGALGQPEPISGDDELAFGGAVAAAGDTHVAVWLGVRRGAAEVGLSARARPPGGPWGPPQVLDADVQPSGVVDPRVAGNAEGEALAVWPSGGSLRAATFTPAGGWSPAVTIAPDAPDRPVGVALGPDGTAAVSWWRRDAAGIVVRAAVRSAAGAWGAPATVSEPLDLDDPLVPYDPPSVSAGAGQALVVWITPRRTFRGTVRAARLGPAGGVGSWRLSAGRGAGDAMGGLDAAGRATVVWSESAGNRSVLRWASQVPGSRWSAPRTIGTTGASCSARLAPRLAVSPSGRAQAVWMEFARRGEVIVAAERPPGGDFSRPIAISRAGASVAALAVTDGGAVAAWTRAPLGARRRPFIEAAVRGPAGPGGPGLRELVAPRLADVRMPREIALRGRLPIRFDLSRPARVEVRFERVRPGIRFVGPVRRGGRAGGNAIVVPSWSTPGRRLGPGVYEVHVQAMTAERASCTITRRLVVRR
jgi:hypothetical protein